MKNPIFISVLISFVKLKLQEILKKLAASCLRIEVKGKTEHFRFTKHNIFTRAMSLQDKSEYELPDGKKVNLGDFRFTAPEIFFTLSENERNRTVKT